MMNWTRKSSGPWPEAEEIRRGDWFRRLMRRPFAQPVAYVAGFLLASAVITGAVRLWDARHDNSVVSSASHKRSGALVVSGQGVTLTFPPGAGWLNVPVTPNQMARFLNAEEKKLPWLRSQVSQYQVSLIQLARNEAMLVYRIRADAVVATCSVSVVAGSTSAGQLVLLLREHFAGIPALHAHVTALDFGGRQGALLTYQIAETGEATRYEAAAEVTGGPETPVITVTTLSPASSLATLHQLLPTLTVS
jgi:hypothetical protein